ncbi:hypothetical protein [Pseudooceanicola nanhaiensis]|uniref:hypothetical protein n=1 Tax=Pseudooceanicola nanhaiensis TaxID=375761 RepID=UPI0035199D9A
MAMTEEQTTIETKRDRVRRLLITPAQDRGMRFRKGTSDEDQRKHLDRLCDELAYLSDRTLDALREWVTTHGEGSERTFWPTHTSIVSTAEAYEPRPLEETPGVAGWFRSRAGEAALAENRLIAEFLWWERKKRPPLSAHERKLVADRAASIASERARTEDKLNRGVAPLQPDLEQLEYWKSIEARALSLVRDGAAARSEGEAA